jgi:5,5'-dehydrodivanillate O-demethylase
VRVSDWTFPNNNRVLVPGITKDHPWMDISVWMVAVDDTQTSRFTIYSMPSQGAEADRKTAEHFRRHLVYNPADHHDDLFVREVYPEEMAMELVSAQDYVAAIGQGAVVDRSKERLVSSDAGAALLRKIFWRELAALQAGKASKQWCRLQEAVELQSSETLIAARA